jgi:hypothetical protein
MTQRIEIDVEGAHAQFLLRNDLAPISSAALWESLPIEGILLHGKLSGEACFTRLHNGPLTQLPQTPEFGVTSIYKGFLVVFPSPIHGRAELLLSYGQAEYRWSTGRRYVTPLAEVEGDGSALYEALRRTNAEGEKTITIRHVTG